MCWFSETWGGAQVFFIVSCFCGIMMLSGHFLNCPPPKIDSTSILARLRSQCRGLCHFDNWLLGVAFCQNLRHDWHKSNHHTHDTLKFCITARQHDSPSGSYILRRWQYFHPIHVPRLCLGMFVVRRSESRPRTRQPYSLPYLGGIACCYVRLINWHRETGNGLLIDYHQEDQPTTPKPWNSSNSNQISP